MLPAHSSLGLPSAEYAETDLARQLQSAFVPSKCHGWPGMRIASSRVGSETLGGDFHVALRGADERIVLVAGTVSGYDLFCAVAKAAVGNTIRSMAPETYSPVPLIRAVEEVISHFNGKLRSPQMECSVFCGVVDRLEGTLDYCMRGGCTALAVRSEGSTWALAPTGAVLGTAPLGAVRMERVQLEDLARLVIGTESLTGARPPSGRPFGRDRFRGWVCDTRNLPIEEQSETLARAVRDYIEPDARLDGETDVVVVEFSDYAPSALAPQMRDRLSDLVGRTERVADTSVYLG